MKFSKTRMNFLIKRGNRLKQSYERGLKKKRLFDLMVIVFAAPFVIPVLLVIAALVKFDSKGPIFYISKRIGLNGVSFNFYKFRTMIVDADKKKEELQASNESKNGVIFKMKKDPRVTRVGRVLRKLSLDELPQLFNILKGDMSLVGPRPAIKSEVDEYNLDECKRLRFLPGLTCIWQVSGRSNIGFDQQVEMDLDYIRNYSMINDLIILIKTVPAVLKGTGAY